MSNEEKVVLSKRDQQMKLRAESMHQERIQHMQERLEKMNIADFNHDVPPDDVDEKMVERTMYQAFRSLIPYTNEW